MEDDGANQTFCAVALLPEADNDDPDDGAADLTLMHGGWCGPTRDHGISTSCARKVQSFLETRPAVLHIDEVVNKKDELQVRHLLHEMLRQRIPVQVAFLQGTLPLQSDSLFPRLLNVLTTCPGVAPPAHRASLHG